MDDVLPCIVCKRQLGPALPGGFTQPSGGVTLADEAAYGSRFDGETIVLTVCDSCLAEHRSIIRSSRRIQRDSYYEYSPFAAYLDKN